MSLTEGHVMSLLDIQATYQEEYNALDDESCDEIVWEFKENIDTTKTICRPSPHGRILDVSNTLQNIRYLVCSISSCCNVSYTFPDFITH
jgi:hypothetical protein